jgi:hypothetical protein
VVVSHPKKTGYIAEAKIESDRVDSKAIAELLLSKELEGVAEDDEDVKLLMAIPGIGSTLRFL